MQNGVDILVLVRLQVKNCGRIGNSCPSSYANGKGSICSNGVCRPESCNNNYQFDFSEGKCQNTQNDADNWCVAICISPMMPL